MLVVTVLAALSTGGIYLLGQYTDIHPLIIIFCVFLVVIPIGVFIDRKERLRDKSGKFV